ncbi:TVP38/TMEM64 family protein [Methanocella sp. CWC-04]|uniref:TVP38/TMEM64 family protein n=1 Tax=Methanooceanicella nereidis TaxID=2052831 RepID=A0AAP2RGH0_9EURY|nr:TVP38/TMEM64 family protein [Methanocella sp. CWC-04]MCD1295817.1 TVP38/TMEM64 family protein [Methanocella sp. CWC-04]
MRAALIAAWALTLLILALFLGPEHIISAYKNITPEGIKQFVLAFGIFAIAVYILIHIIRPFLFLPVTPFTVAGGFLFGMFYGLFYSMLGLLLSATLTYIISRYIFRDYVKGRIKERFIGLRNSFEKNSVYYVAIMRIIPVIPYDVVGYLAGASSVKIDHYVKGSIIGAFPGAFALTMLGSSLTNMGSATFYMSIVLVIIVIVLPKFIKKILPE